MSRAFARALLVLLLLLLPRLAEAGSPALERGLGLLASPSTSDVRAGVERLAEDASPEALRVLEALADRRLGVDAAGKAVVLSVGEGPRDPSVRLVRLDNALRRVLDRSLARLRLVAGDANVRLQAARRLAERPDHDLRELLVRRLGDESDAAVAAMLRLGLAKLDLGGDGTESRVAALRTIGAVVDVSMKDELARLAAHDPDAGVRQAAADALSPIAWRLFRLNLLANTIYGLSAASVLLLAALGLAITFGVMGVINMAHGEMLMIGAYATFVVQGLFRRHAPHAFDWFLPVAIPVAFVSAGAVGILLERTVIRRLYGRPLETLLATWGLSLVLIQAVRHLFGAQNVTVENPRWLGGGWALAPNLVVPYGRVAVLAFTLVVVVFLGWVLQKTSLGLRVRAVTQNRDMAASLGIRTRRVDMWTFGLGSGVAGLGGVALSQLGNVGPELGQQHVIDSFMVVVVGGVGNLLGTILAALGLGLASKFLEPLLGAVLAKIGILGAIIWFIQRRPQGLFAPKGRTVEG